MSTGEGVPMSRALVSVSDKTGLIDFVSSLASLDVQIVSTGGTAGHLREAGIQVKSVSQMTGFPEIMDGRVKTLHPKIHGGILADREKESHVQAMMEHDIDAVDMVIVNLYPFAETVARPGVTLPEAVEQIDIGGPAMIRAAAKNHRYVAVVTDPGDYADVVDEITKNNGRLLRGTLARLAQKAFAYTSFYDGMIAEYLGGGRDSFPPSLHVGLTKAATLRYGENPHQRSALYRESASPPDALVNAEQLHGKELSYNNYLDLQAAWKLVREWSDPACAIIKHNNPCGAATGSTMADAYEKAHACDPLSAFGGIVAFSGGVDEEAAAAVKDLFIEAIIASGYTDSALDLLREKKNLRIMRLARPGDAAEIDLRFLDGGVLAQDVDKVTVDRSTMTVATGRGPTEDEWEDLLFAWQVAAHVKSNAIVLARGGATVGIGAGQMSRVDSSFIAVRKAAGRGEGSVAASDAFLPFPDALQVVAEAGVTACIQPGGSVRDEEVISFANEAGIAMVMTGRRHFRH